MCWLLSQLLGRPVAQAWNGAVLYDVRDTGKTLEYGVRRSVTNLDLTFHTDGPWLDLPPQTGGPLLRQPGAGRRREPLRQPRHGAQRAEAAPPRAPAAALSRRFPGTARGSTLPDDSKVGAQPVFQYDGRALVGRFNERLIETGAELAGAPLDPQGREALDAMRAVVDSPELWVEFTIERGQIQYINNREFAHSRTDFRDAPEPSLKRHLIRVWTREEGRRTFHP